MYQVSEVVEGHGGHTTEAVGATEVGVTIITEVVAAITTTVIITRVRGVVVTTGEGGGAIIEDTRRRTKTVIMEDAGTTILEIEITNSTSD